MAVMHRINVNQIKVGTCFSAPVFFEDGVNMFLSDNKPASQYHVDALKNWPVPYLLSEGYEIAEPVARKAAQEKAKAAESQVEELESLDDAEDLEELDELDELDDAEDLEEL